MYARFNFHEELCVGCGVCVMACLDANDTELKYPESLRKLYHKELADHGRVKLIYGSIGCMHCPDSPCASACPKGCYRHDEETGLVMLDSSECIGCGSCVCACRYGVVAIDEAKHAQKCNGCADRLERDQLPVCVAACPRNAITIDEVNDVLDYGRKSLLRRVKTLKRADLRQNK